MLKRALMTLALFAAPALVAAGETRTVSIDTKFTEATGVHTLSNPANCSFGGSPVYFHVFVSKSTSWNSCDFEVRFTDSHNPNNATAKVYKRMTVAGVVVSWKYAGLTADRYVTFAVTIDKSDYPDPDDPSTWDDPGDPDPDPGDACTCGASCKEGCTCGGHTGECDGNHEHENPDPDPCTCGASCKKGCTCGKHTGDCNENCPHEEETPDPEKCTCGAKCPHCCTCGKFKGECNSTDGQGGCSCHVTPPEECECGACCYCKCTCFKWPQHRKCTGTCFHNCAGQGCLCRNEPAAETDYRWTHCECHHVTPSDPDPGGSKHVIIDWPDVDWDGIGNINPVTISDDSVSGGNYGFPSESLPLPNTPPPISGDGPVIPEPKEPPPQWDLDYFEYKEDGTFPEFQWEKMLDDLTGKIGEKIPLDWIEDLKDPKEGAPLDMVWKIDFEIMGLKVGPMEYDIKEYINKYTALEIASVIWFVLLFLMYATAIVGIYRLVTFW